MLRYGISTKPMTPWRQNPNPSSMPERRLSPAADMPSHMLWPASCHQPTYAAQQICSLLDRLVGSHQQRGRDVRTSASTHHTAAAAMCPNSYCQKPERVPRSSLPASENLHMSRRCLPECSASVRRARGRRKEGSALDQKGKRENQGFAVLATRKPSVSNRALVWRLLRTAARTSSLSLRQEPPRTTRKLGSPPRSHANPSAGAPS